MKKKESKKLLELSEVRANAGRKGAIARWKTVEKKPKTVYVRMYKEDAVKLKETEGSMAEKLHIMLNR